MESPISLTRDRESDFLIDGVVFAFYLKVVFTFIYASFITSFEKQPLG